MNLVHSVVLLWSGGLCIMSQKCLALISLREATSLLGEYAPSPFLPAPCAVCPAQSIWKTTCVQSKRCVYIAAMGYIFS